MRLVPAFAAVLLLLGAPSAGAYVLMGQHWASNKFPIVWALDSDGIGSTAAQRTATRNEVIRAFDAWHNVACTFVSVGTPSSLAAAQQTEDGEGANKVFWIGSGWSYGQYTLGVTTPKWYQGGSEYFDADMVFNARDWSWTTGTGAYCSDCIDTFSIALHEEGHFFGLAHTPVEDAVMFASYPGFPKQNLHSDDVQGICALYPKPSAGTGPQGSACTQTRDCVSGLTCTRPATGTGTICTKTCTGATDTSCPNGYSCQQAASGWACFFKSDAVGDLCKPCESGAGCSTGLCITAQEFAICSRTCGGQAGGCPSGYQCVTYDGSTSAFCFPTNMTCPNNCSAANPCPASQQCVSGTCKYRTAQEGESCPYGNCATGLTCASDDGQNYLCHRNCNPTVANTCPTGQSCYALQGGSATDGACFTDTGTAGEGQSCGTATCVNDLLCVGTSAADATCRRPCNPASPSCPSGMSCVSLTSGAGACIPSSGGGRGQGQSCASAEDCIEGLWCIDPGVGKRCVTDCRPSAPACPGNPPLACNAWPGTVPAGSKGGYCWGSGAPKAAEGEDCLAPADCLSGLLCIRHSDTEIVCRIDCGAGQSCPGGTVCTAMGAAHVCLVPTPDDDDDTGRDTGCPCSSSGAGGLALSGLALLFRRRRG